MPRFVRWHNTVINLDHVVSFSFDVEKGVLLHLTNGWTKHIDDNDAAAIVARLLTQWGDDVLDLTPRPDEAAPANGNNGNGHANGNGHKRSMRRGAVEFMKRSA